MADIAVLEVRLHAEGRHARKLWIEAPGSGFAPVRISHELLDQRRHFPRMEGRFVFKHAVTRMPEVLFETLNAASLKLEDVDLFLFHQANLRINEYVAQQLEIPAEKCFNNIERYGNCSAASLPILLDEALRSGRLERGQLLTAEGTFHPAQNVVDRLSICLPNRIQQLFHDSKEPPAILQCVGFTLHHLVEEFEVWTAHEGVDHRLG